MYSINNVGVRKSILLAQIFMESESGADNLITFCEENISRFSATLSASSGSILIATDVRSLYELGWRVGANRTWMNSRHQQRERPNQLVKAMGKERANSISKEIGLGITIDLNNIINEFYDFYRHGFIVNFHGKASSRVLALATNISERQIFSVRATERRHRTKLRLENAAPAFERYFRRCFTFGEGVGNGE